GRAPGGLTPAQVDKLIAELNDDEFGVRERASALLEKAGGAAEAALRKALAAPPSAEAKKRIEHLLRLLPPGGLRAEDLAAIRGVQVLEYIGTAEARKLLAQLARAGAGRRLGEEADSALARLRRPRKVRP